MAPLVFRVTCTDARTTLRNRRDGWTIDRQVTFLDMLRRGESVAAAARSVGMSRASAYRLRRNPRAALFTEAWAILDHARTAAPPLATLLDDPDRAVAALAAVEHRLAERATRPDFDRYLLRQLKVSRT